MKHEGVLKVLVGCIFLIFFTLAPNLSFAKVTGQCSNCHTMHNSQNGSGMEFTDSYGTLSGPFKALTRGDCLGCHAKNDATTFIDYSRGNGNDKGAPIVYNTQEPTYGPDLDSSGNIINNTNNQHTLAGGNFYWVHSDDAKGHNVPGVASADSSLSTPPGFCSDFTDKDGNAVAGGTWSAGTQVTCAGKYGCHGKHDTDDQFAAIYGAHHEDDSTIDGSTVGKSYRFLYGILGKEDNDWEASVNIDGHNQYKGVDRTTDDISGATKTTISYLCAECHGYFHSESSGTEGIDSNDDMQHPWIRHPTDFDMGNVSSSEYGNYGGASNYYNFIAPVASADVSSVVSKVTFSDDTIVMCLSCHRAHGSPYDDILRWN